MKKIITLLLGMLVFTLGSSTVLAMESEISDPMIVGVVFVIIVGVICWKIFKKRH